MNSTVGWTLFFISYQTLFCIIISWLTLGCKLTPNSKELYEITLMKLLYLYDPDACGRIYFYNHTTLFEKEKKFFMVVWPTKNTTAASIRIKLQVWLVLHIFWLLFGVMATFMKKNPYNFYISVLPFTFTGLALLIIDLIFGTLFLIHVPFTSTENKILTVLNGNSHNLKRIIKPLRISQQLDKAAQEDDTSWISLLFAFLSYRGIVQWIINFWIVKDNFVLAISERRSLEQPKHGRTKRAFNKSL